MANLCELLKEASNHDNGLIGFIEELEYRLIDKGLTKNGISALSRKLRIKRTTLSMKINSFRKKGFVFRADESL